MTRMIAALSLVALLAACGADGEPTPPAPAAKSGISISGTARIGVTAKL